MDELKYKKNILKKNYRDILGKRKKFEFIKIQ